MLRHTIRRLAVSSFTLFMMEQKSNPRLAGLPIGKRGKVMGKMYRSLTKAERQSLSRRAKAQPSLTRKPKPSKSGRPRLSAYSKFVRMQYPVYAHLPTKQRFKAIAKEWSAAKAAAAQKGLKRVVPLKTARTARPKKPASAKCALRLKKRPLRTAAGKGGSRPAVARLSTKLRSKKKPAAKSALPSRHKSKSAATGSSKAKRRA